MWYEIKPKMAEPNMDFIRWKYHLNLERLQKGSKKVNRECFIAIRIVR